MLVLLKICWAGGGERERESKQVLYFSCKGLGVSHLPSPVHNSVSRYPSVQDWWTPHSLGTRSENRTPVLLFFSLSFSSKKYLLAYYRLRIFKEIQPFLLRKIKILYTSSLRSQIEWLNPTFECWASRPLNDDCYWNRKQRTK